MFMVMVWWCVFFLFVSFLWSSKSSLSHRVDFISVLRVSCGGGRALVWQRENVTPEHCCILSATRVSVCICCFFSTGRECLTLELRLTLTRSARLFLHFHLLSWSRVRSRKRFQDGFDSPGLIHSKLKSQHVSSSFSLQSNVFPFVFVSGPT